MLVSLSFFELCLVGVDCVITLCCGIVKADATPLVDRRRVATTLVNFMVDLLISTIDRRHFFLK